MELTIDPTLASNPLFLDAALAKYFSSPSEVGFRCIQAILSYMKSMHHKDPPCKIMDLYYSHLAQHKNNSTFLGHFAQILSAFERNLEATHYADCWAYLETGNASREYSARCAAIRRDSEALLIIANQYSEEERNSYSFKLVAVLYLLTIGYATNALSYLAEMLDLIDSLPLRSQLIGLRVALIVCILANDPAAAIRVLGVFQRLNIEASLSLLESNKIQNCLRRHFIKLLLARQEEQGKKRE